MEAQVTYNSSIQIGYIYLVVPDSAFSMKTEELTFNPYLNLDYDEKNRLIGIEIFGENARSLFRWSGKSHIFKLCKTDEKQIFYSFRIDEFPSAKVVEVQNGILLHFKDNDCKQFLGIDIYKLDQYSKEYLIG